MRRTGVGLVLALTALFSGFALTGCSVLGTVEAPVGGEADILALAAGETAGAESPAETGWRRSRRGDI